MLHWRKYMQRTSTPEGVLFSNLFFLFMFPFCIVGFKYTLIESPTIRIFLRS